MLRPTGPLVAGFLVFAAAAPVLRNGPGETGVQPIAFNHAKHVAGGMGCTDCHAGAQTEVRATLPPAALCMGCHAAPLAGTPAEERLRVLAGGGAEIAWRPVTGLPAHVYFSHRRHVAIAGLECGACHGAMEKLTAPPRAPLRELSMKTCMACHERSKAGNDCNDCHR